ncbi:hypothetical protein OGATHE_001093 [Ogataea polymorpha]|uniref:Secreted protein n=1 Tax=Ogataea polymorpha TaxID=460523 RepID=A0A9P8PSP4_9ASCO|nr:hypothetical protein OGATHE_001093 [Ogataea polymorpha]
MMRTVGSLSMRFCFLAVWSPYEISSTVANFSNAVYRLLMSLSLISSCTCMNGSNVMDDFLLFGTCRTERKWPPNMCTTGDGLTSTCLFTAIFWFAPTSIQPLSSFSVDPLIWPVLIISSAEFRVLSVCGSLMEALRSAMSLSAKRLMLSTNSSCSPSRRYPRNSSASSCLPHLRWLNRGSLAMLA